MKRGPYDGALTECTTRGAAGEPHPNGGNFHAQYDESDRGAFEHRDSGGGLRGAQTVAISPGYVNLPLGGTQQYTATVTGLTPTTVAWGVTAGGGTITQAGLYTAPATLPKNSVLISATSIANPKISTVVYVNPEGPGPTLTAMSPNPLPVGNDTITLTASASAPFVKGATMTCADASLTTKFISATSISAVTYVGSSQTLVACHVNNPGTWQSNTLSAPVKNAAPPTPAPVVSPATATVALGGTQQFSASNVTSWSAGAGSITAAGLYMAPATITADRYGHRYRDGARGQRHREDYSGHAAGGCARDREPRAGRHPTILGGQCDRVERGGGFDYFDRLIHCAGG